ncbi:hypothetical protein GWK47_034112 [Chionoecetes opilio]|uniref:Uncharacterized protein n=1 Tax=Chionoecetes opilio TaxID=41210 RepID=A0A8J4YV09_CHIOP|nr:hypothetical protein GWK47_034112 [Chionoecetes opilio]
MVYDVYGKARRLCVPSNLQGDDEEDVNEPQTSSVPTWLTSPGAHATNIITRKSTSEQANESEWCWAFITKGSPPPFSPADADMPSPTRLDTPTPLPTSPQTLVRVRMQQPGKWKGKAASFQRRVHVVGGAPMGGNIPAHHKRGLTLNRRTQGVEMTLCGVGGWD